MALLMKSRVKRARLGLLCGFISYCFGILRSITISTGISRSSGWPPDSNNSISEATFQTDAKRLLSSKPKKKINLQNLIQNQKQNSFQKTAGKRVVPSKMKNFLTQKQSGPSKISTPQKKPRAQKKLGSFLHHNNTNGRGAFSLKHSFKQSAVAHDEKKKKEALKTFNRQKYVRRNMVKPEADHDNVDNFKEAIYSVTFSENGDSWIVATDKGIRIFKSSQVFDLPRNALLNSRIGRFGSKKGDRLVIAGANGTNDRVTVAAANGKFWVFNFNTNTVSITPVPAHRKKKHLQPPTRTPVNTTYEKQKDTLISQTVESQHSQPRKVDESRDGFDQKTKGKEDDPTRVGVKTTGESGSNGLKRSKSLLHTYYQICKPGISARKHTEEDVVPRKDIPRTDVPRKDNIPREEIIPRDLNLLHTYETIERKWEAKNLGQSVPRAASESTSEKLTNPAPKSEIRSESEEYEMMRVGSTHQHQDRRRDDDKQPSELSERQEGVNPLNERHEEEKHDGDQSKKNEQKDIEALLDDIGKAVVQQFREAAQRENSVAMEESVDLPQHAFLKIAKYMEAINARAKQDDDGQDHDKIFLQGIYKRVVIKTWPPRQSSNDSESESESSDEDAADKEILRQLYSRASAYEQYEQHKNTFAKYNVHSADDLMRLDRSLKDVFWSFTKRRALEAKLEDKIRTTLKKKDQLLTIKKTDKVEEELDAFWNFVTETHDPLQREADEECKCAHANLVEEFGGAYENVQFVEELFKRVRRLLSEEKSENESMTSKSQPESGEIDEDKGDDDDAKEEEEGQDLKVDEKGRFRMTFDYEKCDGQIGITVRNFEGAIVFRTRETPAGMVEFLLRIGIREDQLTQVEEQLEDNERIEIFSFEGCQPGRGTTGSAFRCNSNMCFVIATDEGRLMVFQEEKLSLLDEFMSGPSAIEEVSSKLESQSESESHSESRSLESESQSGSFGSEDSGSEDPESEVDAPSQSSEHDSKGEERKSKSIAGASGENLKIGRQIEILGRPSSGSSMRSSMNAVKLSEKQDDSGCMLATNKGINICHLEDVHKMLKLLNDYPRVLDKDNIAALKDNIPEVLAILESYANSGEARMLAENYSEDNVPPHQVLGTESTDSKILAVREAPSANEFGGKSDEEPDVVKRFWENIDRQILAKGPQASKFERETGKNKGEKKGENKGKDKVKSEDFEMMSPVSEQELNILNVDELEVDDERKSEENKSEENEPMVPGSQPESDELDEDKGDDDDRTEEEEVKSEGTQEVKSDGLRELLLKNGIREDQLRQVEDHLSPHERFTVWRFECSPRGTVAVGTTGGGNFGIGTDRGRYMVLHQGEIHLFETVVQGSECTAPAGEGESDSEVGEDQIANGLDDNVKEIDYWWLPDGFFALENVFRDPPSEHDSEVDEESEAPSSSSGETSSCESLDEVQFAKLIALRSSGSKKVQEKKEKNRLRTPVAAMQSALARLSIEDKNLKHTAQQNPADVNARSKQNSVSVESMQMLPPSSNTSQNDQQTSQQLAAHRKPVLPSENQENKNTNNNSDDMHKQFNKLSLREEQEDKEDEEDNKEDQHPTPTAPTANAATLAQATRVNLTLDMLGPEVKDKFAQKVQHLKSESEHDMSDRTSDEIKDLIEKQWSEHLVPLILGALPGILKEKEENSNTQKEENTQSRKDLVREETDRLLRTVKFRTYGNGDTYLGGIVKGRRDGLGVLEYYTDDSTSGRRGDHSHCGVVANNSQNNSQMRNKITDWVLGKKRLYKGSWKSDREHGQGDRYFLNGDVYSGNFSRGQYDGEGAFTWALGTMLHVFPVVHVGGYKDGMQHGYGVLSWSNGTLKNFKFVQISYDTNCHKCDPN